MMVEVTRTERINTASSALDQRRRDDARDQTPERQPPQPKPQKPRTDISDVSFIMGIPNDEVTPAVGDALLTIMIEFDRQRHELEHAREYISYLEEHGDLHPYLPVLNRRALIRELARIAAHARRSETDVSLVILHPRNWTEMRRRLGRQTLELQMATVVEALREQLRETDIIGGLGGDDLGVIMPLADVGSAGAKIAQVVGDPTSLEFAWGVGGLAGGGDALAIARAADRDMLIRERWFDGGEDG